jgi:FimV-like protein
MYLAQFNLMNGQNKMAIDQFLTILKSDPQNVVALNNIAWAYSQEKDPRAFEYAEKAYKLAGDSAEVLDTLGWMLVEQGNTARGLPMLQKAITLSPDALEVRLHLAQALLKSGDKAKARKELEQIVASGKPFPKMDEAKTLLKQL